jgi:hypothetical protein
MIKNKQTFQVPIGTEFTESPNSIKLHEKHYEAYLEFGKDNTVRVLVPKSVIEEFNYIFTDDKSDNKS